MLNRAPTKEARGATSTPALLALLQQQPTDERVRALERILPLSVVQRVLRQTGQACRHCSRLPFWFVVWLVSGLGLFAQDSYRQIFKHLHRCRPAGTPGRNTIAQARAALGFWPLRLLAHQVVQLLATPDTPGVFFYQGLRLMALDGFVLDGPDSSANARAFGRPGTARAPGAFPPVRVRALGEVGTHVLYRWLLKPCRRNECPRTPYLLRWLQRDRLLLWDRAFLSHKHVALVQKRGGPLLARAKSHLRREPIDQWPDDSYRAQVDPDAPKRSKDQHGVVVRVIAYQLQDPGRPTKEKEHRLVTTLLAAAAHPAEELVRRYHQRWEEELASDEVKTHQQERPVLRSQTPAGGCRKWRGCCWGITSSARCCARRPANGGWTHGGCRSWGR